MHKNSKDDPFDLDLDLEKLLPKIGPDIEKLLPDLGPALDELEGLLDAQSLWSAPPTTPPATPTVTSGGPAVHVAPGATIKVSIRIAAPVIACFKQEAARRGVGYQTLINETLRAAAFTLGSAGASGSGSA